MKVHLEAYNAAKHAPDYTLEYDFLWSYIIVIVVGDKQSSAQCVDNLQFFFYEHYPLTRWLRCTTTVHNAYVFRTDDVAWDNVFEELSLEYHAALQSRSEEKNSELSSDEAVVTNSIKDSS